MESTNQTIYKPGDLLKASDVAKIMSCSRTSAYRLMNTVLPSIRLGPGIVRVRKNDLFTYIESNLDDHGDISK